MHVCSEFDTSFWLGDFNIDILKSDWFISEQLLSIASSFDLRQIIDEPTRVTNTSVTLIDLIFTNFEGIKDVGVIDAHISDHSWIFCEVILLGSIRGEQRIISYRPLKNIDLDSFQRDLQSLHWDGIFDMESIDNMVEYFTNNLLYLYDLHAPVRSLKLNPRRAYSPWITPNIKFMQRLRDSALKRYKRTKSPAHWSYYKQLRNLTTSAIRSEKRLI